MYIAQVPVPDTYIAFALIMFVKIKIKMRLL